MSPRSAAAAALRVAPARMMVRGCPRREAPAPRHDFRMGRKAEGENNSSSSLLRIRHYERLPPPPPSTLYCAIRGCQEQQKQQEEKKKWKEGWKQEAKAEKEE